MTQAALDAHRLQPLMAPRSVAIIGASPKSGSFGNAALGELLSGGFDGAVYPVNPGYETIRDLRCYASLEQIAEPPDLVLFCVANERLEKQVQLAAETGVKAGVIFGSCYLAQDTKEDSLLKRLRKLTHTHSMQICGGNCMGFRNRHSNTLAGVFDTSHMTLAEGPVACISHSGTAFALMTELEGRVGYTFAVSAGQEIATTAADYLDYALEMDETRCVAMFLETIRDPDAFAEAVHKAHARNVPVVVIKVGRSAKAAEFAISHSGAMVGNDAAYDAYFERHGVQRVDSMDELVNAIQLFAYAKPLAAGGVAAALDSGGKRELLVDIADEVDLALANLSPSSAAKIAQNIDPHHDPVNPLDYWGTGGADWGNMLHNCLEALANDEDTAICLIASLINWGGDGAYSEALLRLAQVTDKPVGMLSDFLRGGDLETALRLNSSGLPVLVGERSALKAIKAAMAYRDFKARSDKQPPVVINEARRARWCNELKKTGLLDEAQSLALLGDYGVPTPAVKVVENSTELAHIATELGYPIVMKTAMPGIAHKSDVGGVALNLTNEEQLQLAYRKMTGTLGPRVLLTPYVSRPGVEMVVGMVSDPLVGHLVMVGLGGTLIEVLDDKVCVPTPSNHDEVRRAIRRLKCARLLDGVRGAEAVNIDALIDATVCFSQIATELGACLQEIDINPLLVSKQGVLALDALVVGRTQ